MHERIRTRPRSDRQWSDCRSSGARVSSRVVVLSTLQQRSRLLALLAGDEEKGFCDVVLDGMVDFSSDYERNTPMVSTVLRTARTHP